MKKARLLVVLIVVMLVANIVSCSIYKADATESADSKKISVSYRTHVQNDGWQNYVSDGKTSGTSGRSLRLEGINIKLSNNNDVNIKYQVHVQNEGWQDWKKNGEQAGTTGKSLRLEGIKIKLENAGTYKVMYRVHVQNIGWQDWKQDGDLAGTTGKSLRLEAIEIKIIDTSPHVTYNAHVQEISWQGWKKDGATAGTSGKELRVEALEIKLSDVSSSSHIKYRVHVQDIGWQEWKKDGAVAGTTGKGLRIEAIQIELEGLSGYTVEYRTHVQNIGWQDWVSNGMLAGTTGESLRVEAIQIRVVKNENTIVKNTSNNNSTNNNNENSNNTNTNTSNNTTTKKRFDVNTIDTSKYPGYKEKIQSLMKKYSNWDFKLLYTGLTLEQAVQGEYSVHSRNLVPSNYSGEWICSVCGTRLYDSGWYCASEKAIQYYMDSRNFLDEINVFQFLDLNAYSSDSVSLDGIKSKVKGSFLENYAEAVNNACKNTKVNPYYIIARLIQEQGYKGTTIGTGMDGGDGKTYYNPFNIGATGNGRDTIYANALATAKNNKWDSMEKAIEGGISFCKKNWLENYQNTLYQNKFDIDSTNGTSLYTHQYMQNLMGAFSEAKTLRTMYVNTNKLNSTFTFIIPVYEKMGKTLSAEPSYNSEASPINVKVTAKGNLNLRSEANTSSRVIKTIPEGEVILSIQRGINSNWQKVVLKDGTVGFVSGTYVQQVADVTNCKYTAYVKTSDGSGCYVRVGPTTKVDRVTALAEETQVTVINEGIYNNIDGYNWVRILLQDGRQAFIPSKYISKQK